MLDTAVKLVTGYYRFTDIFFEWYCTFTRTDGYQGRTSSLCAGIKCFQTKMMLVL